MSCKHTPSPFDPAIEDEGNETEFEYGVITLSIKCSKCGHRGMVRFTWDSIDWNFTGQGPILGID